MYDEIVYSYIDEIGKRLGEPSLYGAASLMVGAGFSKNADCIGDKKNTPPDWTQLSERMYEALYPCEKNNDRRKWEECSGKNVLTLAQKYEVIFDRQSLNALIERSIADKNYVPSDLHRKLLELNWNDVFTTNYDTLLERAIEQVATRKNYKIVYSQDDLPGSVRPRLVKLHGSIEHSGQYIITEEDYRTYPDKYAPFVNTVQQSMLETRLCLIGFSGSDPNFLSWLGWLRDNMGDNCPAIYLCGVFDNLGIAERKMLEQQHITVLDLSVLVEEKEKNKHYVAIKKFIERLKETSEKKKEAIFSQKSYAHVPSWNQESKWDVAQYVQAMIGVMDDLIEKLDDYICLPKKEADNIGKYIDEQLRLVVHEEYFEEKYILINSFCAILKKCNRPLYDDMASKLLEVLEDTNVNEHIKSDIALYLLQMYRVDGKFDEYIQVKDKIDVTKFDGIRTKNEYYIEYVKYYMCKLDVNKAYEYLDKIEITNYDECALKKASLLSQLNKKKEAKELLTSTIAFISQQRYSENKNASLIGYANLVARASWTTFNGQELFSDFLYEDNIFNCRKVIIESRDSLTETLIETILKNQRPSDRRINSFNPNSYTVTYKIICGNNETDKISASFKYLLLQDLLCIGIYPDQKNATDVAIEAIEYSSKSPLWRWYQIIRTNDKNLSNLYFTRERIYNTQLEYVEKFYEQIISLLEVGLEEGKNKEKVFIDYAILTDIASKMTIVLDENSIIRLIEILIQIDTLFSDKYVKQRIIGNPLNTISYNFNNNIFNACIEFILDNKLLDYRFTSYFVDLEYALKESNVQQHRERLIESLKIELDSKDPKIRSNAVNKFKLFETLLSDSESYEEITEKVWSQVDSFGLPSNNIYLPIAWLEDTNHNAEEKIIKYLLNPQISSNYDAKTGTIHGGENADAQVHGYYAVLYGMLSKKQNDILSKEQICRIIEYFYHYVNNEKNILARDYDILGDVSQTRKRFIKINNIILLLCITARVSNTYDEDIDESVNRYLVQIEEADIDSHYIKMSMKEMNTNEIFAELEKRILYSDQEEISSIFTMLYGVIQMLQSQNKDTILDALVIQFIQIIPYYGICLGKKIILEFHNVICNKIFLKDENKKCIVNMLNTCYDIFKNAKEEHSKDGLDGMYNVSNLAKTYYEYLKENGIAIGTVFEILIEEFKTCRLNEIRFNWL